MFAGMTRTDRQSMVIQHLLVKRIDEIELRGQ